MFAVPPVTGVPPLVELPDGLVLLLELQAAATIATAAKTATAAKRSLGLHRFMCAPSSCRARARDAMPVPAQALRLPVCTRANPQHPRSSGPAGADHRGRLRVTLMEPPLAASLPARPGVDRAGMAAARQRHLCPGYGSARA